MNCPDYVELYRWWVRQKRQKAGAAEKSEPEPSTVEVVPGKVVRVFQTRPRCMEAGHCCWVSEADCDLYPLLRDGKLSGLCRERIPERAAGNVPAD
jgi:hypothetical protein